MKAQAQSSNARATVDAPVNKVPARYVNATRKRLVPVDFSAFACCRALRAPFHHGPSPEADSANTDSLTEAKRTEQESTTEPPIAQRSQARAAEGQSQDAGG
jgi:hypothetical protein